ncbi:MAG TPA: hypothetical protein VNA27_04830 [Rubrobacteraceae bacterium]|nr:hypothetical protein [Rubrobacteraceae bacterium]
MWRRRATEEQNKAGWEMWVRMEKTLAVVLHEAYDKQVEETIDALSEGPESFYSTVLGLSRDEGSEAN